MENCNCARMPQYFVVVREIHKLLNNEISKFEFFDFIMNQLYYHRYEPERIEWEEHCKKIFTSKVSIDNEYVPDYFDIAKEMLKVGDFDYSHFENKK